MRKKTQTRPFCVFARSAAFAVIIFFMIATPFIPGASAAPGILQLATRDGFWNNQFPDKPIMLTHFYSYWADEFADSNGDTRDTDDTYVGLGILRLIKPWHFGDRNQFQYILEGILSVENLSIDTGDSATDISESGLYDPMIYTSIGWNNESKTTHLQLGMIGVTSWGDDDLHGTGDNSYKLMPLVAVEQQFGNFWIDASMGYFHYFDDLSASDTHGKDYFEVNVIPSYHIGAVSIYVQGDYKLTQQSELYGNNQNDDGFNFAVAPGIGWWFRPDMQLNLKYVVDVDGENELQGQGLNLRFAWIF